jgi:NADP-dependent alcohol dehydrogenase
MGHELTALFGIDHARTLAIITPSHYKFNFETKKEKLAQYAERVWDIKTGDLDNKAKLAIDKTELFFKDLDIDTKLSNYTKDFKGTAEIIADRFKKRGWTAIGEHKSLTPEKVIKIVEMAY